MLNWLRSCYYQLPPEIRQRVLVKRRSRLWLKAGILFIHIPKAAGTSINVALYGRFMGHPRATDIERWGSTAVKSLPRFAMSRNPWERVVSAYRFARRGQGVGGSHQAWIWRPQQYQRAEFESFDRFVNEWLANRDIRQLDQVFQSQSSFVCDSAGKLLVDHVGRLDDLEPTRDFLRKHLGSTPDIGRSNISGAPMDYRELYTPETVATVGRIYAEDIDRFGYEFSAASPVKTASP